MEIEVNMRNGNKVIVRGTQIELDNFLITHIDKIIGTQVIKQ
jgi:hypothetical protein